ncbi:hypothetical protein OG711_04025 [Streptomyces uncialis]|uniref:hypothetical protein n=1 Tax=Streptomyces uncialis TaxID=1048205 RepID=UPI002E37A41E|nr:hypothetical protein [Streptomyces uncialis]
MWQGCTPVLDDEPGHSGREITGWRVPGTGELDIESEGFGLTVSPTGATLRAELSFARAYTESGTEPYRELGPVTLVLEDVTSLALGTPGAPEGPLWKRVLGGDPRDETLRMEWEQRDDILHVRENGIALSARGGNWHWRIDG